MAFSRTKFTIYFFCIISWVISCSSFIVRFVCFSSQNFWWFGCFKNSIFALQVLEKQLHVFAWPTLHKYRQTLSYMWKFTWEKDIVLWIRPPREIYSAIFHLKHIKTGVAMITIRAARAKLNKETLGKIKNTSKNDRRGCPPLLKFG